jgi:hypothetical protein
MAKVPLFMQGRGIKPLGTNKFLAHFTVSG